MDYSYFVEKVKQQDSRNTFESIQESSSFLPESLNAFYTNHNPIDVEVVLINSGSLKLYPKADLKKLQEDYQGINGFVFATLESDPVFLKKEKVYIAEHGSSNWESIELLSHSFDDYLLMLHSEIKV